MCYGCGVDYEIGMKIGICLFLPRLLFMNSAFERLLITYVYRLCFDIYARICRNFYWKWLVKSAMGQFLVVLLE